VSISFRGRLASVFDLLLWLHRDDRFIRLQHLLIKRESDATPDALSVSMQVEAIVASTEDIP
jgi:hypothetical protein